MYRQTFCIYQCSFNVANFEVASRTKLHWYRVSGVNLPKTISPGTDAIPNSFGKKLCVMNKHFTYPLRQSFAVFLYPFIQ